MTEHLSSTSPAKWSPIFIDRLWSSRISHLHNLCCEVNIGKCPDEFVAVDKSDAILRRQALKMSVQPLKAGQQLGTVLEPFFKRKSNSVCNLLTTKLIWDREDTVSASLLLWEKYSWPNSSRKVAKKQLYIIVKGKEGNYAQRYISKN